MDCRDKFGVPEAPKKPARNSRGITRFLWALHTFWIPNVLAHVFDMHPLLERFFYLQFRANRRSTRADSLEYCSEKGDTREVQSQVEVERERLFGSDAPLSWRIRHRRREGLKFAYLCAKTRNRGSRKVSWL